MFRFLIALVLIGLHSPRLAADDLPCPIDDPCSIQGANGGTYRLVFPESWDGAVPLKPFFFFHGHNGSGAGVARNVRLARQVGRAGYVLVAPDGPQFTFRGQTARGWAARPEGENPRGGRDDIAFVEAVLDDLPKRLPVMVDKTVLSGFSSGGSMAWFVSCYSRRSFSAVVALAGGLRRPLPLERGRPRAGSRSASEAVCPGGPRKVLHIHGFTDRQVPLEGRGIRAWHQGDVFEGLAVQRATNLCGSRPSVSQAESRYWCREWTGCKTGAPVRLCLHPGGHGTPPGWLPRALGWING